MASTISVRLESNILKDLDKVENKWQTDRSEVIRRLLINAVKNWKIKDALERLKERKITISEAAKDAEVSLWEMIDLAKHENIDWIEYNKEDLKRDLKLLE
ncbi:MAG: UPF0175 family protein [Nanoarchaeota archaeon]